MKFCFIPIVEIISGLLLEGITETVSVTISTVACLLAQMIIRLNAISVEVRYHMSIL